MFGVFACKELAHTVRHMTYGMKEDGEHATESICVANNVQVQFNDPVATGAQIKVATWRANDCAEKHENLGLVSLPLVVNKINEKSNRLFPLQCPYSH